MRRLLIGLGVATGVVLAGGTAVALPNDGPTGRITDVRTTAGRVQFVFTADNLKASDKLVPESVAVTVGGQTLDATASISGSGTGSEIDLPPREVVLALDTSGSMDGDGIVAARNAALSYVASLPGDVKLGLLTFSNSPKLLVAPTSNRDAVRSAIAGVTSGGDTALYDAVIAAVQAMKKAPAGTEKRLVILSDGDDTVSKRKITDAIGALNGSRVAADVVAFRLPGDRVALNQLASSSNGQVIAAAGASDLAKAFAVAAQAFKQQVLVTVQVPTELAGKDVTLNATLNAGSQSVMATKSLTLPAVAAGAGSAPLVTTDAVGTSSKAMLWLIIALAFVALLAVLLVALWVPATSAERTAKQNRLAEVGRYRVIESVGLNESPGGSSAAAGPTESNLTKATLSFVDRAVRARGKRKGLVDELERAGMRIRPEEWAVLQASAIVIGAAALGVLTGSIIGVLAGALLGYAACRIYVRTKISHRAAQFEAQLPDMLQLVAGSLRSGFSLNQAIAAVVSEGTEPTASEFARALTEVRLGTELEDALDGVADRMKCLDLHLVVMAIRIAREVGGNLAEVLLTTVGTMRERAQLKGQVKVLSAEGRLSAKILTGLPLLMATYLVLFKPGYLDPLFSGVGILILAVGITLLITGTFWLSRIVKIEV